MTTQESRAGDELALRAIAMPAFANSHGDIFGGWLLSQMDLAGGTAATRLAKGRVVTVAVTTMNFQHPVYIGDEVSCYTSITKVGRTSITVNVKSFARRGRTGDTKQVTEGLFIYVAVDPNLKPRPVYD
jgi:acyl-CoA thioesterase YciA